MIVGIHPVPREFSLHRVFWRELSIIGARVYERADFEAGARTSCRRYNPSRHHHLPPSRSMQYPKVLSLESGGEVMKVLLDCQSGVTP